MDLALDYFNLDTLAEVKGVSILTGDDIAVLDAVYSQQVDCVSCADVVVASLELARNFLDEDAGVIDLDRFSIAETAKDG